MSGTQIHVTLIRDTYSPPGGPGDKYPHFFVQNVASWKVSDSLLRIESSGSTGQGSVWYRTQCFPLAQIRSFDVTSGGD